MIRLERRDGVHVASLAKPPHNGLDDALASAIEDALATAIRDGGTVLHVRSDGPAFCAGTDRARLEAWFRDGADALLADHERFHGLFRALEEAPIVILAEIGGPTLGAGLGLALACDLRVAAAEARLGVPEAKAGALPPGGTIGRLAAICGRQVARRLLLTAELVDGTQALALGLVDRVVPANGLSEAAASLAARIDSLSPGALKAAKRALAEATTAIAARETSILRELAASPPDRERFGAFVARLAEPTRTAA